jgi:hypothetical protein
MCMNKKIIPVVIASLIVVFFTTCRNKGKNGEMLSPDVVENPNTANGKGDLSNLPVIKFDEDVHDFGKIIEGETVSYNFKFINSGKTDLIIADVTTSCGCTVPSFSKTPIRPGMEGFVKVSFNSAGKRGWQTKNIAVVANTQPNTTPLRIKAQVVSPGGEK